MCHTKGTSGLWGGSNRGNKGGKLEDGVSGGGSPQGRGGTGYC